MVVVYHLAKSWTCWMQLVPWFSAIPSLRELSICYPFMTACNWQHWNNLSLSNLKHLIRWLYYYAGNHRQLDVSCLSHRVPILFHTLLTSQGVSLQLEGWLDCICLLWSRDQQSTWTSQHLAASLPTADKQKTYTILDRKQFIFHHKDRTARSKNVRGSTNG